MLTTNSYLFCIFLAVITAIAQSAFIQIPLYKRKPYKTFSEFKANVDYYKKLLPFFFFGGTSDKPVAKIDKNVDCLGQLEMGFPKGQRFTVAFDTTFSGFWIPSSDCYLSISCYSKQKYHRDSSITYLKDVLDQSPQIRKIMYNTQEGRFIDSVAYVSGDLGFDTLKFDDRNLIQGAHFLEVTSITYDTFNDILSDGVLGLGLPDSSLMMNPPFLTMLDRGLLDRAEFSLYVGKNWETGELFFGGRNKDLFNPSTLQFHPVNNLKNWVINVDSILFKDIDLCPKFCEVLIDTGSALIAAPAESISQIYKAINMEYTGELAEINCGDVWKLPELRIGINGQVLTLKGYDYTVQFDDTSCTIGIMECPQDSHWILGNLFLANVYTIFNIAELEIGFANLYLPRISKSYSNESASVN